MTPRDKRLDALKKQWYSILSINAILSDGTPPEPSRNQRGYNTPTPLTTTLHSQHNTPHHKRFMPWGSMVTNETDFSKDYLEKNQDLFPEWEAFFSLHGFGASMVRTHVLKAKIRNGVPDEFRGGCYSLSYLTHPNTLTTPSPHNSTPHSPPHLSLL